jgi:hypothetical protein
MNIMHRHFLIASDGSKLATKAVWQGLDLANRSKPLPPLDPLFRGVGDWLFRVETTSTMPAA